MTLPRITALATIVIHVFASVAMGLVYLCQMSGQVGLAACCCPSQARIDGQSRDAQAGPIQHDAAHAPGCCDVSQIEASLVPSLLERRTAGPLPDVPWAWPWAWSIPDHGLRLALRHGSSPARVALSPPQGPPLYVKLRSLLL